jgi:hypothetical protein
LEAAELTANGFTWGWGAGAGANGSTKVEGLAMTEAVGVKVKPEKSLNRSFDAGGLEGAAAGAGAGDEKKSLEWETAGAEETGAGAVSKKSNSTGFGAAAAAGLAVEEPPKSPKASADFVFEEESAKGSKLDTWLGRRSSFWGAAAGAAFFSTDLGGSAFFVTTSEGRSNLVGLFWKSWNGTLSIVKVYTGSVALLVSASMRYRWPKSNQRERWEEIAYHLIPIHDWNLKRRQSGQQWSLARSQELSVDLKEWVKRFDKPSSLKGQNEQVQLRVLFHCQSIRISKQHVFLFLLPFITRNITYRDRQ